MFDTSHHPKIGVSEFLREGLRVVTAPNASPMTFTGTRSYILGEGEVAVIDPGPEDEAHFQALKKALAGQKVSHIFVTHSHIDHSALSRRLSRAFDAPVLGFGASGAGMSEVMRGLEAGGGLSGGEGVDTSFLPDIKLADGDIIAGQGWALEAVHTPGHMSNHLCFGWQDTLFSGDHVMGWSSTLISPPDGDLTQFMGSLEKLQNRPEDVFYPGHGAPIYGAQNMVKAQISHRLAREQQILEAIGEGRVPAITRRVYKGLDSRLLPMAERNVFAHLIDLCQRGKLRSLGPLRFGGRFELVG
ncbi:MAG: MBL fold metallo-hydrolase [Rhodobacteraceae bacterium]|nr:MBL fold metallo-hydrolase [Paracoccaceae bacterium]